MLATQGPASPSSAVIFENWSRCADADAGTPSVQASAMIRAVHRKARVRTLEVPDANMTTGAGGEHARDPRQHASPAGSLGGSRICTEPLQMRHPYNDRVCQTVRGG